MEVFKAILAKLDGSWQFPEHYMRPEWKRYINRVANKREGCTTEEAEAEGEFVAALCRQGVRFGLSRLPREDSFQKVYKPTSQNLEDSLQDCLLDCADNVSSFNEASQRLMHSH